MTTQINYEKYANMSERQLLNALLNTEKQEAKVKAQMQNKLNNLKELVIFLKAELKSRIDKPRYNFIPLEESEVMQNFQKEFNQMSEKERAELEAEVNELVNKDYDNEL